MAPGQCLIIMLKAYLDDSGDSADPAEKICCIAGLACLESKLSEFEEQWDKVLAEFKVPYLHMKEFAHSAPKSPFADWKGDEEKRRNFISKLLDVLEPYAIGVSGATVPISEWHKLDADRKEQLQDPYFMCLQETLVQSAALTEMFRDRMDVIFSDQSEDKGKAYKLYSHIHENHPIGRSLSSFSFASFKDKTILQAADLIAFEVRRFGADLEIPEATPLRAPMKRLFKMYNFFNFFGRNEIVKRFYDVGLDKFLA
jgi:hypothetical protein